MSSSNLKNFRDFDVIGVKIRRFLLTLHVGLTTCAAPVTVADKPVFGSNTIEHGRANVWACMAVNEPHFPKSSNKDSRQYLKLQ